MTFFTFDRPRVGDEVFMRACIRFLTVARIDEAAQTLTLAGGNIADWEWPIRDLVQVIQPVVRRDGQEGSYQWK